MDGQTVSLSKFRFNVSSCVSTFAVVFALTLFTTHAIEAQTFSVLHNFTGGADGGNPYAGVTIGPSGVLYGTTSEGGTYDWGTVFKLSQVNLSGALTPLYEFTGGSDGGAPYGGVVFGPNGALYGTTRLGTVFELRPGVAFAGRHRAIGTKPCFTPLRSPRMGSPPVTRI